MSGNDGQIALSFGLLVAAFVALAFFGCRSKCNLAICAAGVVAIVAFAVIVSAVLGWPITPPRCAFVGGICLIWCIGNYRSTAGPHSYRKNG